ncbi:SurA N-terminal domain-containing protein [Desulfovibrio psychrotolerans]|uniref:Peptidylprolyl isomerase n=1 Tax=Desulfovibrio psychrotolerans TaxID=415242 RepID=A0A7J0BQU1_9BACT|nr:SurA N-terminal domain-containing protein [Desulfovibrio psychrotolerans]GFM35561.1 peptidylprolyl isomerase [Desulfovibrio psychrotolerans]
MFSNILFYKRVVSVLFVTTILLSASFLPVRAENVLNKIVAFVNGDIITQFDLQESVAPDLLRAGLSRQNPAHRAEIEAMERRMLDSMISDLLFLQEADRYKIEVKDAEVENEIRKLAQQNGLTLEEAQQRMKEDGVSYDNFKEKIRNSIVRSRLLSFMVGRKVVVTKEDVQAYYDEHKGEFSSDRKVVVRMLALAPGTDAGKVYTLLQDGTLSFEEAVDQFCVGPAKKNGGLLGELTWMHLASAWREALEPLSDGQVSKPFTADGVSLLLKLDQTTAGNVLPLEEVAGRIEETLRAPMLEERFSEYSGKLREKAVIKINL